MIVAKAFMVLDTCEISRRFYDVDSVRLAHLSRKKIYTKMLTQFSLVSGFLLRKSIERAFLINFSRLLLVFDCSNHLVCR